MCMCLRNAPNAGVLIIVDTRYTRAGQHDDAHEAAAAAAAAAALRVLPSVVTSQALTTDAL